MTLERIIDICKAYSNLGTAIAEQVDDVLDGRIEDVNASAVVHYIVPFLRKVRGHADLNGDDELREEVDNALEEIAEEM